MSLKEILPTQSSQAPEFKGLISDIIKQLPPIKYNRLASSEIDYYGASHNIARGLGLTKIPYTRASWHHGWYKYPLCETELIVNEDCVVCCKVNEVPNLVATKDIEHFLRGKGFPHAIAVGDPLLYTQQTTVERIPGSLLIIPEHSIKETNVNIECNRKPPLPDTIASLKSKFSTVVACIGGFCVSRNNYGNTFEGIGIPWILGAWLYDSFALQRIRNLFSQFEYIATDSIGSHIPYAGYCGCKLIYYGKGRNLTKKDFSETPIYIKYPKLIDIVIHEQKLETIQKRFPILFSNDTKSEALKTWSMEVLGAKHQITPNEIAELIGWKIRTNDENSWEYIPGENPGLDAHSRG
jgi:hypothetical protein